MARSQTLDRLLNQLNTSPTAKSDQPLWQVISQLIKRLKELEALVDSSTGGGGGGGGTTITNINNSYISGIPGEDGEDGMIMVINSGSSGGSGITADYVVASDGATPIPSPLDDGFGNFIYVAYTP